MIDKRKREIGWMRCQIIFIIFIIMCSAYMIIYDECNRSYNAISITDIGSIALLHDENEIEIYREKGRPIIYYTHDGCQFVTVYDDKHELVSIVMLNDVEPFYDTIHTSHDWSNIFSNNDEANLLNALIANNTKKALEKDLEYNNLRRLPYSYMDLSLLTKGDSARYYLEKSIEYFDDYGDKIARCKYAWWHIDELHPDTVIAYAKPHYEAMPYAGNARILAEAYLRKSEPDSALVYIKHIESNKIFAIDANFYDSRRLYLLGEYKEASESWEKAYYQQMEKSKLHPSLIKSQ